MAVIQIKDANNKEFSVDDTKIFDFNGDMGEGESRNINDSLRNRVHVQNDVQYVNSKGEVIDANQLLKDSASGKVNIIALDIETEATHSGKNHNYCIYYEDSMEKDAESFVNPFNKPMLKNHDSYSEPLGRIKQSWFGPSKLTDERSAIHLKTRVTDQDAIPKFLDGRYGTVSIGGTMGTVTCNICGKTILKDGKFKFCGHWRGESYKDEMCYWGAKDITYHEVSTVNNPADDFAQIMKVTVVTDSDNKKDSKEDNTMAGQNTDTNHTDTLKQISDMIDDLLGKTKPSASDSTQTPEQSEVKDGEEQTKPGDNNTGDTKDSTDETEKIKKELADAKEKISSLEKELEDSKAELAKTKEDLTAVETDATQFKEKCITLATANKELVADSIITKENVEDDKKEARKEELLAMSMKDLNKLAKETKVNDDIQHRTPASVQNPTLANPDKDNKDSNGNADTNKQTTDDNKAKKTVDDFAKDIVSKLVK